MSNSALGELLGKILNANFLLYLTIGGLTALLYMGLIFFTVDLLGFQYQFGVSLSYFVATLFHFLANKKLTFQAANDKLVRQVPRYAGVIALHYLIVLGVVSVFVSVLGASVYIASALAILLASGVGYLLLKFWVFRG
jgi:putative flippase GtrA